MTIIKTEADAKAALERFARVQRKSHFACPRCGVWAMDEDPMRNALSRYADVQICNSCGMDEALRAFTNQPLSLLKWSLMQVFADNGTADE